MRGRGLKLPVGLNVPKMVNRNPSLPMRGRGLKLSELRRAGARLKQGSRSPCGGVD